MRQKLIIELDGSVDNGTLYIDGECVSNPDSELKILRALESWLK